MIGHLGRHVDFAFLFVRRARAAACVDAWPNNVTGLALNGPIVLLTMFGVVASLSLFLGVSWARWPVSLLCIYEVLSSYVIFIQKSPRSTIDDIAFVIAIVSLVFLFWPRPETVG